MNDEQLDAMASAIARAANAAAPLARAVADDTDEWAGFTLTADDAAKLRERIASRCAGWGECRTAMLAGLIADIYGR